MKQNRGHFGALESYVNSFLTLYDSDLLAGVNRKQFDDFIMSKIEKTKGSNDASLVFKDYLLLNWHHILVLDELWKKGKGTTNYIEAYDYAKKLKNLSKNIEIFRQLNIVKEQLPTGVEHVFPDEISFSMGRFERIMNRLRNLKFF